jgi:hypothetical protein
MDINENLFLFVSCLLFLVDFPVRIWGWSAPESTFRRLVNFVAASLFLLSVLVLIDTDSASFGSWVGITLLVLWVSSLLWFSPLVNLVRKRNG